MEMRSASRARTRAPEDPELGEINQQVKESQPHQHQVRAEATATTSMTS